MTAAADLTRGPIRRQLIALALPLLAGNILQQLYNTIDAVIVGRFVGGRSLCRRGSGWVGNEPVSLSHQRGVLRRGRPLGPAPRSGRRPRLSPGLFSHLPVRRTAHPGADGGRPAPSLPPCWSCSGPPPPSGASPPTICMSSFWGSWPPSPFTWAPPSSGQWAAPERPWSF